MPVSIGSATRDLQELHPETTALAFSPLTPAGVLRAFGKFNELRCPLKENLLLHSDFRQSRSGGVSMKDALGKPDASYLGRRELSRVASPGSRPRGLWGTIVKAKHHAVIIKTDVGKTESYDIAKDASAETPIGVVSGLKFEANEGERVTVRYLQTNGLNVAQFIHVNWRRSMWKLGAW
jgi:hypothetical protein